MRVGLLTLEIRLPGCDTLKEKRHRLKGVIERVRSKFNVSVSEVGRQDAFHHADAFGVRLAVAFAAGLAVPGALHPHAPQTGGGSGDPHHLHVVERVRGSPRYAPRTLEVVAFSVYVAYNQNHAGNLLCKKATTHLN